jgi:hypothetical protein
MKTSLDMRSIFRCMMEEGYYPEYEKTHILFGMDSDTAVVEYEEGILSIRVFFSIEEDAYDLFLEASNAVMAESLLVKPAILDDMKNIMFSCEIRCETVREFRKNLPWAIEKLREGLRAHKIQMKKLILANELVSKTLPATDDSATGSRKLLS